MLSGPSEDRPDSTREGSRAFSTRTSISATEGHPTTRESLLQVLTTWLNRSRRARSPDVEAGIKLQDRDKLWAAQNKLLQVISTCNDTTTVPGYDPQNRYSEWYLGFLDKRWRQMPEHLKSGLRTEPASTASQSIVFMKLLCLLANQLTDIDRPTLKSMAQESEDLLHPGSSEHGEQLIFLSIGWLTMLYDPSLPQSPKPWTMSILRPLGIDRLPLSTDVFRTYSQPCAGPTTLPIHQVLKHFGQVLPIPSQVLEPSSDIVPQTLFSEQLVVNYLRFYTLSNVAKIRLEFVNSWGLHLEFDQQSRILKIFRFPSFCSMMCSNPGSTISPSCDDPKQYLQQLFANYYSTYTSETNGNDGQVDFPGPQELSREILLSYRLIFGQHKPSWTAFLRKYHNHLRKLDESPDDGDPLLERLCGCDYRGEPLYTSIGASSHKEQYSAQKDFPFLGSRLLRLQQFVLDQNPSDLRTLWHDRRDILRFWTFWAVVVIGGLSLLLSLTQNILGIMQVANS